MKIILPNGVVIEMSDGENISSDMIRLIAGSTATASVAPVPTSEPAAEPFSPFLPLEEFSKAIQPPARKTKQPTKCYMTQIEHDVMQVLLEHPEGITSQNIAKHLGVTHSAASSTINRITNTRPMRNSTRPLIVRHNGGMFRVSDFGRRLKYVAIGKRQAPKRNEELGW